jgi:hypothetical protein
MTEELPGAKLENYIAAKGRRTGGARGRRPSKSLPRQRLRVTFDLRVAPGGEAIILCTTATALYTSLVFSVEKIPGRVKKLKMTSRLTTRVAVLGEGEVLPHLVTHDEPARRRHCQSTPSLAVIEFNPSEFHTNLAVIAGILSQNGSVLLHPRAK